MERHFDSELDKLKEKLIAMGKTVEKAVESATASLIEKDPKHAEAVIAGDLAVDQLEMEIDELGHELIALHQPAAQDLRLLTMVLKIDNDLERIGDHAVNIAERSLDILKQPVMDIGVDLKPMAEAAQKMLDDSLQAFIQADVSLAKRVLDCDDRVDDFHRQVYNQVKTWLEGHADAVAVGLNFVSVSQNLERIADLSSNIAEDVIYW